MGLRSGAEYLDALRDAREVYLDGRRVDDVTAEPGLAPVARTFARIYDLAQSDEYRDALTFEDERGGRVSGNWIQPRTPDELAWRRGLTQTVARQTGGLFGRAPDYVPLFHLGMLDIEENGRPPRRREEGGRRRRPRREDDRDVRAVRARDPRRRVPAPGAAGRPRRRSAQGRPLRRRRQQVRGAVHG